MKIPRWLERRLDAVNLFITTGFLPQRFRDQMGLPWHVSKQRRFNRLMAALGTVNNLLPRFIRQFPFKPASRTWTGGFVPGARWSKANRR